MHYKDERISHGLTIIEALVSLALITILSVLTFATFSNVYKSHALDKTRITAVSLLEQARSNSMASRNSLSYGVHFATTSMTLFEGQTYNPSAVSNFVFDISPFVELSTTTLSGGGQDVIFGKLTGTTSDYGSISFIVETDASSTKSVIIHPTGIIE